jgi:3-phenylpropionate/trans-cinnamate dioxygenase ferredoxin subunit
MAEVRLAGLDEIPENGMTVKEHAGMPVLLARCGGQVYAMDDICTHSGASLHEGRFGERAECFVTCPWHAASFDVRTGKVVQETPWAVDTRVFPVRVEGNDVYVEI